MAFLRSLHTLVSAEQNVLAICWNQLGTAFEVRDVLLLCTKVLPLHFAHNNFASFTRQLHMYNFTSTKGAAAGADSKIFKIFSHPNFLRDRVDLLSSIERKSVVAFSVGVIKPRTASASTIRPHRRNLPNSAAAAATTITTSLSAAAPTTSSNEIKNKTTIRLPPPIATAIAATTTPPLPPVLAGEETNYVSNLMTQLETQKIIARSTQDCIESLETQIRSFQEKRCRLMQEEGNNDSTSLSKTGGATAAAATATGDKDVLKIIMTKTTIMPTDLPLNTSPEKIPRHHLSHDKINMSSSSLIQEWFDVTTTHDDEWKKAVADTMAILTAGPVVPTGGGASSNAPEEEEEGTILIKTAIIFGNNGSNHSLYIPSSFNDGDLELFDDDVQMIDLLGFEAV
jgi:hypothetical protein